MLYNSLQHTRCDQKIVVIFKFRELRIFDFRIFEMLTVGFAESTMSRTQVQLRYNRFKESQEDVNDDVRPGRANTSTTDENIEIVKKMILDYH